MTVKNFKFKIENIYRIELDGVGVFKAQCFKVNYPFASFFAGDDLIELNLIDQAFCVKKSFKKRKNEFNSCQQLGLF
jgi:hypothetical protein